MNRIYLILPVALMLVFGFFYNGAVKENEAKEAAKKLEEAKKKDIEDAKKRELEEKARIDAERRTAERLQQDKDAEAKRVAKYQDAIKRIQDDIDRYKGDIDENIKLVAKLEKDIADMRIRREKEGREVFELLRRVELAKIQRRNAELEIQRFTEMVARRAGEILSPKAPSIAANAP